MRHEASKCMRLGPLLVGGVSPPRERRECWGGEGGLGETLMVVHLAVLSIAERPELYPSLRGGGGS